MKSYVIGIIFLNEQSRCGKRSLFCYLVVSVITRNKNFKRRVATGPGKSWNILIFLKSPGKVLEFFDQKNFYV